MILKREEFHFFHWLSERMNSKFILVKILCWHPLITWIFQLKFIWVHSFLWFIKGLWDTIFISTINQRASTYSKKICLDYQSLICQITMWILNWALIRKKMKILNIFLLLPINSRCLESLENVWYKLFYLCLSLVSSYCSQCFKRIKP
jgi:hypothetical protein